MAVLISLSMVVLLALSGSATAATGSDDVVALLGIKASLDQNPLLANWVITGDPCAQPWYGVVNCTSGSPQRVTNLQLQNSGLSGTISPFLGNLTALTSLDMSSNRLTGPIPATIANLVNISRINLHSNKLTGTLQLFSKLRTLTYLNVGDNLLTGGVPPEFNNLTLMTYLSIGMNPIGGPIPDLSKLTKVIHIHFDNMNLTGPLPATLSALTSMIHLVVQNNQLSGTLPPSLSALTSVSLIQLDNNFFTGTLPASYSNLTSLIDFRAVNNQLSGPIDPSWLQLKNLRKLDLSYNDFSGVVPSGIGDMPSLIDLNLEHNSFSGAVPASVCYSPRMTTLRLNANLFSGALPASCYNMTSPPFQTAWFHDNQLTGDIPSSPDDSVGITAFGNSWCAGNAQLPACQVPPTLAAAPIAPSSAAAVPAPTSALQLPKGCSCPSGQVPQPYTLSTQLAPNGSVPCSCVSPSQFVINLPGVSFVELTPIRFQRLAASLAATLNLLPEQVTPEGACRASDQFCGVVCDSPLCHGTNSVFQLLPGTACLASRPNCTSLCKFPPCTGTTAAFQLLPVEGQQIPASYIQSLETRLTVMGANSWFSNKIDDDFVPYTLVIAQPPTTIIIQTKTSTSTIVIAVIGAVVGMGVLLAICAGLGLGLWWHRRRRQRLDANPWLRAEKSRWSTARPLREGSGVPLTQEASGSSGWHPTADTTSPWSGPRSATAEPFLNTELRTYSFAELEAATDDFSTERAIGSGGFGTVYRATFPDDSEVAVKRLSLESKQGEPEFLAEIGAISQRLKHPNLLRLMGYCSHGRDRLLVYELMRRGDLRGYLRDGRKEPMAFLDWETRLNIACDSTAGLQYLHEGFRPPVVHRDIKTSNILLDDDFRAKISDFGLAKLYPEDDATHITTKVQGTYGYLAPDYATTGLLNTKSDVYSMGVVFLELFAGVVAVSATTLNSDVNSFLVPWARRNSGKAGFWKEVMDPALEGQCPPKAAKIFAALAVGMSSHDPNARPTMSQVAYTLEMVKKECAANQGQPSLPRTAGSNGVVGTTSASGSGSRARKGDSYRPFEPQSGTWAEDSLTGGSSRTTGSEGTWVQMSESESLPEHSTLLRHGQGVTVVRPEVFQGNGR
ncbi:Protein kinase superfamily protein [Klebsormidium nitens]|uniref:non-specific serine/threonine protein kinase n=1 Tax=Klebsormidium nitens TaxID=105231 RepID=A0A1Y1HH93_KLENI|nr:Protein kinase superfamily protein [Klebsormidium nitens]|eukprot:GAQ77805.1 Protein kinase superfamily protein [Klebsormidium nitens]